MLMSPLSPNKNRDFFDKLTHCALQAHNAHVCEPRSIFADVHAAGKNALNFICACGRKLCEAFLTV